MKKRSAAPTEIARIPNSLVAPAPNPIAVSYSPFVKGIEESTSPDASPFPICEDLCGWWVQQQCVMVDAKGHSTDEPCVIGDEWTLLLERFVSGGLPIDEQIRRRSLVVTALTISKARITTGLHME